MEIRNEYFINRKTVLFHGVFHLYGELFTRVIEGKEHFLVAMSPIKLIEESLISYGGNFKGALSSSRKLLGENRKMYPIKIDSSLDIWIFPTKSYTKVGCVWFVFNHVKKIKSLGIKNTKIFLNYGHEFDIEMREASFRKKQSLTSELRDKVLDNKKNAVNSLVDQDEGFYIIEENGQYTYETRKEEE